MIIKIFKGIVHAEIKVFKFFKVQEKKLLLNNCLVQTTNNKIKSLVAIEGNAIAKILLKEEINCIQIYIHCMLMLKLAL